MRTATKAWEDLAYLDPLWAVLSDPAKRGGRWALGEFLEEGEREVREFLALAERHGFPGSYGNALDYGCGPGRMTRALAGRFDEVYGVDVSPEMVRLAGEINKDVSGCAFEAVRGDGSELPARAFDVVISSNVLQHIPSTGQAIRVLERLAAAVRDGGTIIIQLTTEIPLARRLQPRPRIYAALRTVGVPGAALARAGLQPIRMKTVSRSNAEAVFAAAGLRILERSTSTSPAGVRSDVYAAGR